MAVPVTTGKFASNETEVYTYLTSRMNLNKAAACGVLANIYKESEFNPQNIGDNGTSYGICQWHNTRWTALKNYCSNNNLNSTTLKGQLEYLNYELRNSYPRVLSVISGVSNTAQGTWDAAAYWCARFEIPSGWGSINSEGVLTYGSTSIDRANYAKNIYWSAYADASAITVGTPVTPKGSLIVREAFRHVGKPYLFGAAGPDSFDCSGFVYYCYKTAINYSWNRMTAYQQYKAGSEVSGSWREGDLVCFIDTYNTNQKPNISHIGIATGAGGYFIHAGNSGVRRDTLESSGLKGNYYATRRILADVETVSYDVFTGELVSDSDTYLEAMLDARERIESSAKFSNIRLDMDSDDIPYGYLVDLTNGGEFRFLVPEFDTNVKINWDHQPILGRSVDITGYNSTASNSISISLDIAVGVGVYSGPGDQMKAFSRDIAFLNSLGYPDYSKAIAFPPPVVYLYLSEDVQIRGVVESVAVRYKKPYDNLNRAMVANVSFTVLQVSENPPDYLNVRNSEDNSY